MNWKQKVQLKYLKNNLVTNDNSVSLIDWDDILLAPPERDTWFLYGGEKWNDFLEIYRKRNPEYTLDPIYYKFYLHQRYFADMTDWLNNILGNVLTEEEKFKQFAELKSDCFEDWLRPLVREYSGD